MQIGKFRDEKRGVRDYFRGRDLRGKIVVDVPAGKGRMTKFLRDLGAEVIALDLFTYGTVAGDVEIAKEDLTRPLSLPCAFADYILCQEGIEHLPDQMTCFKEFNRILKEDGLLVLTTPNYSNLRARFYHFLLSSNSPRHLPANEVNDVWYGEDESTCFGHIFLMSIQRLRVLARVAGFKIKKIYPTKLSETSFMLFILFYPLILLFNSIAYVRSFHRRKEPPVTGKQGQRSVLREVLRLNLNPVVLLSNHLFVEFEKCAVEQHRFL